MTHTDNKASQKKPVALPIPKYNIGDALFRIHRICQYTPCAFCDGSGKINVKKIDFSCPSCKGRGKGAAAAIRFKPSRFVITQILITIKADVSTITYASGQGYDYCYEGDLMTRKDCLNLCAENNSKVE